MSEGSRSRSASIASVLSEDRILSDRAKRLSFGAEAVLGSSAANNVCGCAWSKNAKTLFVSLVLFSTITLAQTVGALVARSMALLADCSSMALDAVTYAINLAAECKEEPNMQIVRRNQLIASGVSFAALVGISAIFFTRGMRSLVTRDWEGSGGGDEVNAWVVLGFAIGGIVFDCLSLLPHFVYGLPCLRKREEGDERGDAGAAEKMNLCSALMHVSADLLRSTTTLTESILILGYGITGDEADSYATVIVSGTIVLFAVPPIVDWFRDLKSYFGEYGSAEAASPAEVEMQDRNEPLIAR
eukprot:TRINITY_DN11621_c0_g1_i1.p1 TRINITY_DN11621_c0_g1~~TRINITY_DN11621_c0_g1_i1.p1  ORF type:complete len:301 (+),score=65.22 TRINITY_DN11621_c0_g1_i1:384-1286(+)